jgi:hypothetical protein
MPLLDKRFSDVDNRLREKLKDARDITTHRGVRGNELAGALGQEIRDHLIDCASCHEQCEVRDTHGSVSPEIDLILLNRFHPPFLLNKPRTLLIEGVLAAAEVKTALNKAELEDCLTKARAFKRLVASVDLNARTVDADWPRYYLRRPYFAFAYEDRRNLGTIQRNVVNWISENRVPEVEQIDPVFVLNRGIIMNLGAGVGTIIVKDCMGEPLDGIVRRKTHAIFSQLIS